MRFEPLLRVGKREFARGYIGRKSNEVIIACVQCKAIELKKKQSGF